MSRLITLIFLLLLLSGCSMLRKQSATVATVSGPTDTLPLTERQFNRRIDESLSALTHYISSASSATDSVSRTYFGEKVRRLLHSGSMVRLQFDDGTAARFTPDSLLSRLSEGSLTVLSVDSVVIPLWERSLLSRSDNVEVHAAMWSGAGKSTHTVSGLLPVALEFTEDGPERVVTFGDLFLSCRNNVTTPPAYAEPLTYSTVSGPGAADDLPWYDCRVKLVDEFFDRFNGKELRSDIVADSSDVRLANLMLLFDADMFSSPADPIFDAAKAMARQIIDRNIRINYSDTLWMARAECQARYKGTATRITLYLKVEQRKADMYKWVIDRAEGHCLTLPADHMPEKLMIFPDAHETDFMALHDITTGRDDYITAYAPRSMQPDPTSVFFALVYAGTLDIDYVDSLSFIFYQVPGYRFSIRNFERDSYNCGWLIDSFEKITD